MLAAVACGTFVTVAEPLATPLLRRAAIDVPNLRSSHSVPTPRGGGAPTAVGVVGSAPAWLGRARALPHEVEVA